MKSAEASCERVVKWRWLRERIGLVGQDSGAQALAHSERSITSTKGGRVLDPPPSLSYLPPIPFFSSFFSSPNTTFPPWSFFSSFLSPSIENFGPVVSFLSFCSVGVGSPANDRVDSVPKLRNATNAINPLNRFMRTSYDLLETTGHTPCTT